MAISCHLRNVIRAAQAGVTVTRLQLAVPLTALSAPSLTRERSQPLPDELEEALDALLQITHEEYHDWLYVSRISLLVYHATLFDTFLQDTIEFLLHLHPAALSDCDVSFKQVMAAERHEIMNAAVRDKVRAVGFLSFSERLAWLRNRFGLRIDLDDETLAALSLYSDLRNQVVHDQGWFEYCFRSDGSVGISQTRCPGAPTRLGLEDVAGGKRMFALVASRIARAVFTQVIKTPLPDEVERSLLVLEDLGA